jgi:ribosomal protein S18 acetylase RimI-like enzyme
MEIRRATLEDAHVLSALNVDVQQIHAEALPHLFKQPTTEAFSASFMAERLAAPSSYFFIAHVDGRDVGYISAQVVHQPENVFMQSRTYLYIDQISVKPDYQGQGYGQHLVQEVRALARREGIDTIVLDVWSFNEQSRTFFAKQGFVTFNERMWIREAEEPPCAKTGQ